MTPHDDSTIRPHLGRSSGFQSAQYRMMEFILGGRNEEMIALHDATPAVAELLRAEAARPSLYDEAIRLPARRGFAIDPAVTERDRKSVVEGKSVTVRVDLGGRRSINKKKN